MISQISQIRSYNLFHFPLYPEIKSLDIKSIIQRKIKDDLAKRFTNEKGFLEWLSVLGEEFSIEILNEVESTTGISGSKFLEAVSDKNILLPLKNGYRFKDKPFHLKIYKSIPLLLRRNLHNIAGYIIGKTYRNKLKEHYPLLAHHFKIAGNTKKAAFYLEKAGDYSDERFKNKEAIKYYFYCIKFLAEEANERKLDILIKILTIMYSTGRWSEFYNYFSEAENLSKDIGDKISRAKVFNLYGSVCFFRGNTKEAIQSLRKAEILMLNDPNNEVYGETMRLLGRSFLQQGKNDKAEAFFNKTLKIGERIESDELKAKAYENLGRIYRLKSKYVSALEFYNKAMLLYKQLGNVRGISDTLEKLGVVNFYLGNYNVALKHFRNSNRLNQVNENSVATCNNLGNIGSVYFKQKNLHKAAYYYGKQLHLSDGIQNLEIKSRALGYLGLIYEERGVLRKSLAFYQQQIIIYKKLNNLHGISNTLSNISLLYSYLGKLDKAIVIATEQVSLDKKLHHLEGLTRGYNNIGTFYLNKGEYKEAIAHFKKSLTHSQKLNSQNYKLGILFNLSECYYYLELYTKAMKCIKEGKKFNSSFLKEEFTLSDLKISALLYNNREYYTKINLLLKIENNLEFLSKIYFVLWEISVRLNSSKKEIKKYAITATNLLEKLYRTSNKYQYHLKILKITTWLKNV